MMGGDRLPDKGQLTTVARCLANFLSVRGAARKYAARHILPNN